MIVVDANVWVAAFDPSDRFHAESVAFFRRLAREDLRPVAPALLLVEVGGAIARRTGVPSSGAEAVQLLRAHPGLMLLPCDDTLIQQAAELASTLRLRGADAIYAAAARTTAAPLVTWDAELRDRAGGREPEAGASP